MFEFSEQTLVSQVLSIKNNRLISEIDMEGQRREVELEEHRKEKEEDTTENRRSGLDEMGDDINERNKECVENTLDNNRENI